MPNKALIEIEQPFCAAVWDALKGDHNDLRKQAIILVAFREAIAAAREDERAKSGYFVPFGRVMQIVKVADHG